MRHAALARIHSGREVLDRSHCDAVLAHIHNRDRALALVHIHSRRGALAVVHIHRNLAPALVILARERKERWSLGILLRYLVIRDCGFEFRFCSSNKQEDLIGCRTNGIRRGVTFSDILHHQGRHGKDIALIVGQQKADAQSRTGAHGDLSVDQDRVPLALAIAHAAVILGYVEQDSDAILA
jgi:hypothetical protein